MCHQWFTHISGIPTTCTGRPLRTGEHSISFTTQPWQQPEEKTPNNKTHKIFFQRKQGLSWQCRMYWMVFVPSKATTLQFSTKQKPNLLVYEYAKYSVNEIMCTANVLQTSLTSVFWKADIKRWLLDLLFKEIFLVQEQYDRRVGKPFAVTRGIKQAEAFLHSILHKRIYQHFVARKLGPFVTLESKCTLNTGYSL